MTMNRNDMDDLTKEWHDMARREFLKRRMVASASACYSEVFFQRGLEPMSLMCLVHQPMILVRELEQVPEVDSVVPMNSMDSMARSEDRPR